MTTRWWLGRAFMGIVVLGAWSALESDSKWSALGRLAWAADEGGPGATATGNATADQSTSNKSTTDEQPTEEGPLTGSTEATKPKLTPPALSLPKTVDTASTAEFDKAFTQWRELLVRMRAMQVKFLTAADFQRPALKDEYVGLVEQGEEMVAQLEGLAATSYEAKSGGASQAGEFLFMTAVAAYRADDLEKADRLLRSLIDDPAFPPTIYDLAGTVAFGLGDMDRAEEYLSLAQQKRVISTKAGDLLKQVPAYREFWERENALRQAEATADDLPRVLLRTSKGDIVVELFENEAPNTVANFIDLVEKRFYNGLTFHRVLDGFMAQGGCPNGTGTGGPGYAIEDEHTRDDLRRHFRGSLSMAKTQAPHSGGSQFFLMFAPNNQLDGMHTVFGRVIEGMDVVSRIQRRDPDKHDPRLGELPDPDTILEAKVLRKRDHDYTPKKYRQEQ